MAVKVQQSVPLVLMGAWWGGGTSVGANGKGPPTTACCPAIASIANTISKQHRVTVPLIPSIAKAQKENLTSIR
jgi:hypothetical protein